MRTLTFLGGTGTVTGSKFLLDGDRSRVLVDAGLFQGLRELRRRNWEPLGLAPAELQGAVLSHAHLDHCGYLPRLTRDGFRGPAYCSNSTAALAEVVLRDSAHLQEEDAAYAREKGFSRHAQPEPLYDTADAERAIQRLRPIAFDERIEIADRTTLRLTRAGHILGSSTVAIGFDDRVIAFSGDLGRPAHPVLRPPADPPAANLIVVESTYGDRRHEPPGDALATVIRRTARRGGSVLIPAFAVDRTEVLLHELARLLRAAEIPELPVYVDSPMALAALAVYRRAIGDGSPEMRPELSEGPDPFDAGVLHEVRTAAASRELNDPAQPSIVISASGMATGGRVVHHLAGMLPDPRHSIVLSGFQAVGTRGRDLAEGAQQLKMHGRYIRVRAEIVKLPGFSVHADSDELIAWLGRAARPPEACFVVHGEPEASAALAQRIRDELDWVAVVPRPGEQVRID
jgi:metallo-beta-lactamase family protein